MIRLFAAVAVPPDIGEDLMRRQGGIDRANWRPLEAFHITLKFYGDVREDIGDDLDAELLKIGGAPFDLTLQGAGSFGEGADIHAVWAGMAGSEPLTRLAKSCDQAARRIGIPVESRGYRPHVTLAYTRRPNPAEVAAWIAGNNLLRSPSFTVRSFGLYSSRQTGEGSRYRLEASYPLA